MAMDGNALGDALKAAVDGVGDPTDRTALFRAIANAIVGHITANAEIATSVAVTSVSGVTTGAGVSGPGTGSGTGTIS